MTTVYPLNLHIGPISITGYGVMMMVGFLMGGWLMDRELRRRVDVSVRRFRRFGSHRRSPARNRIRSAGPLSMEPSTELRRAPFRIASLE